MIFLIILVSALLMIFSFEMLLVLGIPTFLAKEAFFGGVPDIALIQKLVAGIDHTTLLAIPFFIFAAHIMSSGKIASKLTTLVKLIFGHRHGGMGLTAVGSSMAFGSVSGSAPATVAALGKLLYPELLKAGYRKSFSLGLIVSSSETALLIPPSITLIIYGWMTGTSVTGLFVGGLSVGVVLGLAFALLVFWEAKVSKIVKPPKPDLSVVLNELKGSIWALGMPVLILGGIYSGLFTATEAAAVSVIYAIFVEGVIYRGLTFKKLYDIAEQSAIATSIIFILLAFGGMLSFFVTLAQVPDTISHWVVDFGAGPILFLFIVNIVFLIAGMFIDPNSALLILVPPLYPVAVGLGIDPIHFGLIVTLNICIGMITPPFGLDIFVASSTLDVPVTDIIKGIWPFIAINLAVLALITYVSEISIFLPNLIL
ncbi:TRAP transporter large permease [Marinomonas colpomeniae]|uniref:TRAP transporter large permease protein n=1 Tax=Marinomonas colpomeniae TaxID=2774408 RepID=A0ABR8P3F4_9GAMM|nr:TRAP transporter large permease [Marinomonas colpomeniae]MBD5771322.1 TRAP transporter large permease [Marinomonas colpomeniae]